MYTQRVRNECDMECLRVMSEERKRESGIIS